MLSQQSPRLSPGRHQRQNSTPTVSDAQKTFHRRGLSLDQPGYTQQQHGLPSLDENSTRAEYILGQQLIQTATMREAQQQSMARPGHEHDEMQRLIEENALRAEQTATRPERDNEPFRDNQDTTPTMDFVHEMHHLPRLVRDTGAFSNTYHTTPMMNFVNHTHLSPRLERSTGTFCNNYHTTGMTDCENDIQQSLQDTYKNISLVQQPCTPPSQTRTSYFPMTPATTPFSQNAIMKRYAQSHKAKSSPTRKDPNLTIKASHEMQRGTSCHDNFAAMRQHAMSPDILSPPNTAPLEQRKSVDMATFPQPNLFNMATLNMDIPLWNDGYNAANYSPMSNAVSSAISSFQSSPEMAHMPLFGDLDSGANSSLLATNPSMLPTSRSAIDLGSSSSSPSAKQNLHSRSQSMSEIEDFNECIEETGVTCDEIAAFISFPDTENKWTCLFTECGKKFGRKENIKSHVQTHLDDRQFRCKDCNKRFVRQHDLKRHANIHSGVRSYSCPCGRGFARHDALTRHRQRGMCIGAFEGTPKKVTKRGRPKKTRPEAEERLEKSAATRQRALEKLAERSPSKYASSISGSSAYSHPSPEQFYSPAEQVTTPPEHIETPPELGASSSSPAVSNFFDFDGSSEAPVPFQSNIDIFGADFDLSVALTKDDNSKDANNIMFEDYFSGEVDHATVQHALSETAFNSGSPWAGESW